MTNHFKQVALSISILSCAAFCSCNWWNDFEKFKPVDLEVSGVTLAKTGVYTFKGEINPDGSIITFIADTNSLSSYRIDDGDPYYLTYYDNREPRPYVLAENDWVKLELVSYTETQLTVSPNNTGETRRIFLEFGCCYNLSEIYLSQESASDE